MKLVSSIPVFVLAAVLTDGLASETRVVAGPPAGEPAPGAATEIIVMTPAKDSSGRFVTVRRGGASYNVYQPLADSDPRAIRARAVLLESPLIVEELRLLDAMKTYQSRTGTHPEGADARAWKTALQSPFFFSVDGSFEERAWLGFVLRTAKGDEDHLLTPFVEMISGPDEPIEQVRQGVAHEIGHLVFYVAAIHWMLPVFSRLATASEGGLPCPSPVFDHDIQRVTSGLQALNEGVGSHFQTMDHLIRAHSSVEAWKLDSRYSVGTARSFARPRMHRVPGVIANRYVFEPLKPSNEEIAAGSIEAVYSRYRDAQPLDNHRLRHCGEMLASEGVVATILTRLVMDERLRSTSPPKDLSVRFAPSGTPVEKFLASLGPGGTVYLRFFHALAQSAASVPPSCDVGLRETAGTWVREMPADAAAFSRVFVPTTLGATASASLADRVRRFLAESSVVPHRDPQGSSVSALDRELTKLADDVKDGKAMFAACGAPLWVEVTGRTLCPDAGRQCLPFQIDLNAAGVMELRMIPGIDGNAAAALLAARERRGYFESLEEFLGNAVVPAASHKALRSVAK